jgi:hypothetical protein
MFLIDENIPTLDQSRQFGDFWAKKNRFEELAKTGFEEKKGIK